MRDARASGISLIEFGEPLRRGCQVRRGLGNGGLHRQRRDKDNPGRGDSLAEEERRGQALFQEENKCPSLTCGMPGCGSWAFPMAARVWVRRGGSASQERPPRSLNRQGVSSDRSREGTPLEP